MSASGGKTADTIADTGVDAPTKRRPGRPRMKDSLPADPNDNSRRSRMRLAQRSYRSRKENELTTTKARADALQKALNSSLDEFIRFHELSSGKEKDLPSEFVLQLNKTAMNIMAIARSAQTDEWPSFDQADRLLATMTDSHAIPLDIGLAAQTTDLNEANRHNPVRLVRQTNPAPLTCSNSNSTGTSGSANFIDPLLMPADSSFETFVAAANPDYTVFGQQRDVQVVPSGMKMFTPTSWTTDVDAHVLPMDMAMHHQNNPEHINIMFNLDNLIMRLAAKAVCLGPCPGIRRGHVDEAIRDSVVQMPPM